MKNEIFKKYIYIMIKTSKYILIQKKIVKKAYHKKKKLQ